MKPLWLALIGLTIGAPAWAQRPPGEAAPLQQQWQQDGSPPVQQAPLPPLPGDQPSAPDVAPTPAPAGPATPAPAPAGPATMERPNVWIPARIAKVRVLDKVDAQTETLTIAVGQSVVFGSLTIAVKACVVRPPDQPADAAAYLTVTDSHPDAPGFAGWMLENEPSVSIMQNPIYDLSVAGCG